MRNAFNFKTRVSVFLQRLQLWGSGGFRSLGPPEQSFEA